MMLLKFISTVLCIYIVDCQRPQYKPFTVTHISKTYLKPRIADIHTGDIVLDPLCGGGSIKIEGSLSWPSTYHLAGDVHEMAVTRAADNLLAL